MKTMLRLWNEETGAILSAEIVLVMTILVIGIIAGLKSLRDSVVTELADVAQAIANLSQTYSFSGASGHHVFVNGSAFYDLADFCDYAGAVTDVNNSKCVLICSSPNVLLNGNSE